MNILGFGVPKVIYKKKDVQVFGKFCKLKQKKGPFFGPSKQKPCIFQKKPEFSDDEIACFFCVLAVGFRYFENKPNFFARFFHF